jgi:hypothetical protein
MHWVSYKKCIKLTAIASTITFIHAFAQTPPAAEALQTPPAPIGEIKGTATQHTGNR